MSQAIKEFVVPVGGAKIAGIEAGQGEAIVFIHAGVADRRMWRAQVAGLSDRYRCVAYDARGAGETTSPNEAFYDMRDLLALLDALGIDVVTLVGCSNGGAIAIDFALAWPERVRSLVLIAPGIRGAPRPRKRSKALEAIERQLVLADLDDDDQRYNEIEAHLWLDGPRCAEGRVADPAIRALFLEMNGHQLRESTKLVHRGRPADFYDRLDTLQIPTLLIVGEHDLLTIIGQCGRLERKMPNARIERMRAVAHLPSMEQPERVNQLLRTFLEGVFV